MKNTFIAILFTTTCHLALAGGPVHVIITAGQSNTDGRVDNINLPDYIKALSKDTVSFAEGAYKHCKIAQNRTDGQFIPFWPQSTKQPNINKWAYDAVTYYWLEQLLKHDFYVIKWAVGGTGIAPNPQSANGRYWSAAPDWLAKNKASSEAGKSLLLSFTGAIDSCIDRTLSQLPQGYQIDAFLWHQGESDKGKGDQYYENLKTVVAYVRHHLTRKTGRDYTRLPFIFGTVSRHNKSYDAKVEASMKRLAEEYPDIYLIDMSDGELQRDQLHFTGKSAEYLGRQMYNRMVEILDK